jgi:hypothetical protein
MPQTRPPRRTGQTGRASGAGRRGGRHLSDASGASIDSLLDDLFAADSAEAQACAYLALQCVLVRGARQGLLVLGAEQGPYTAAGVWPEGVTPRRELLQGAERAIAEREAKISFCEIPGPERTGPRKAVIVAQPVVLAGQFRGAVVLEIAPRSERELLEVLQRLLWGQGWLDSLFRRFADAPDAPTRERFELVLAMLAASLDASGFHGAATGLATELATEFGCDRVSIGTLDRHRMRVRALSHSAQIGKKTSLVRAIEAAMDEALDQQTTIVHPAPSGPAAPGTQAHQELANRHGQGASCTILLLHGEDVCGAITLERSPNPHQDVGARRGLSVS